jgi:hypothetical protein
MLLPTTYLNVEKGEDEGGGRKWKTKQKAWK